MALAKNMITKEDKRQSKETIFLHLIANFFWNIDSYTPITSFLKSFNTQNFSPTID